jgi:pimeloyl-ACP methyl ester carboxylesterase
MSVRTPEKRQVAGLPVTVWPGSGPSVLALAGLGGNGTSWAYLAEALPDAHVVAPDLRGRGDACGMSGPSGLLAHAQDCARLLAELDLADVVVIGHSMGAYLAPVVAQEGAGRIRKLVLVDGGIPPKLPFFMRPVLTKMAFKKEMGSVDRAWESVEALAKKAKIDRMVASRPDLKPLVYRILEDQAGPDLRPRADIERCADDAADTFFGSSVVPALEALTVPADVFLAENKKWDGQGPFISDKAVAPWRTRQPLLRVHRLTGNHMTVLFAPEVLAAVSS